MTTSTHLTRIQAALDFIEENLREDLRVDQIARVAAYSSWHFQRVFGAIVGETVWGYVRRRRLAAALVELISTSRPIADIAWEFRFESQEAFTRAFKGLFGLTPGRCRREKKIPQVGECVVLTRDVLDILFGGMHMEPVIRSLDAINIVGRGANFISILSPDADNFVVIPQLWDDMMSRRGEIRNVTGEAAYGLCGPIEDESQRRHADEFFYLAGLPVTSLDDLPEGMIGRTVPAATYAVFTHVGRIDRLGETMNYIYGSWLPGSEYERQEGPDLELYDKRFAPTSDTSEMDILIPVRKR
jgi:AraC family transcriptional regulator